MVRCSWALCACISSCSAAAYAQDEYEIQVYDTETAHRGESGLELHLSYHVIHAAPDEVHETFEPHYGVTEWLELGGYFQLSGSDYAGAKLRAKARLHRGIAINGEISDVPSEPGKYGGELRPIVDWMWPAIYAAANPIVSFDRDGAHFEPAAKLAWRAREDLMLGVEGYAASDVERAFAVVDFRTKHCDVNFGLGVNRGSPDHPVVKLIFGIHP